MLGLSRASGLPVISSVTMNEDTVAMYGKLELTIVMTAAFTNPFDYNQITLKANFFDKDNQHYVVDGFYYQDYVLNTQGLPVANGAPVWKVRFASPKTGNWLFYLQATDQSGTAYHNYFSFYCQSSQNKGFVKQNHPRYLQFDNGQTFLPVGMNMCWSVWDDYSFTVYQSWLDSLAANGGNNTKIMMVPWGMSLEWNNTVAGNYTNRLNRAWALDWTLEKALERNIYLQLCTLIHGELVNNVSGAWDQNPYNAARGGPCNTAPDFFTNAYAKQYFKQKLRYINARWGYLTNIWSWEILSEADQINFYNNYPSQIRNWMVEMGNYMQSIDLQHRVVSSAYAVASKGQSFWQNADVDYTQLHLYDQKADLELDIYTAIQEHLTTYTKPVLVSEYALAHLPETITGIDPSGISLRNCLWTTSLSGSMGSGLHWWWDNYITPQQLYRHFKPVSKLISAINPIADNLMTEVPDCSSAVNIDLEVFPRIVDAFVKAPENQFVVKPSGIVTPSTSKMNSFEYGYLFNQYRNPPTFTVYYDRPGAFTVHTGNTVSFSNIRIWLNGASMLNQGVAANSTYTINVPAGQHTIFVENTGTGMMEIAKYEFFNYSPMMRAFLLRNNTKAVGWFQNRNYNWEYIQQNGNPAPVANGKIKLSQMNPGYYSFEWLNGQTGLTDSVTTRMVNAQNTWVNAPPVLWDGAFRMTYQYAMIPGFGANVQQGNNPLTVQFTDLTQSAVGDITSWKWSFGDGTISNQKNPSHIYWQAGTYTVKLVVQTGSYKDSIQKTNYITVNEFLEPNFIAIPTTVQLGDSLRFYDLSLGNIYYWFWEFGDGTSSNLQNPFKLYNNPGIYSVKLTVKAGNITKTITKTDYITIVTRLIPQFTAFPLQVISGQPVQFTDLSGGSPTQWIWRLGDGTVSTVQHPQHIYTQTGSYSVKLVIKKLNFSDSLVKTGFITVFPPLKAGFRSDRQYLMPGETVQFTDTTVGGPEQWYWEFGDGTSGTVQHPAHTYINPGNYTVKLKVTAGFRTDSTFTTNYITVLEPLVTGFIALPTEVVAGQPVHFTDTSAGNPTSWHWDFGDGNSSTEQHPVHQYQYPGSYDVKLKTGILTYADSLTRPDYIIVYPVLDANFAASPVMARTGDPIQFTDISTGGPLNWWWEFGDGNGSILQNPVYSYAAPGTYSVKLKVTAGFRADSVLKTNLITIKAPLSASFTGAPTLLLRGQLVQFQDQSAGQPTFWLWDFGDQSNAIGPNPNHVYANSGTYTVTLVVMNELEQDTLIREAYIKVLPPMQADFTADRTILHKGQKVEFTDLSVGGPTIWKWDFGDGAFSTQQHPSHIYQLEGTFTVKLQARNSLNQNLAVKNNYITVLPPLKVQTISIPQGWSGISGFVIPDTALVSHIFGPVINDLIILKNLNAAYWPGGSMYTLTQWETHSGYEINMLNEATVTFRGILDENRTVTLTPGWNLLPVISPCKVGTAGFFAGLPGITLVKEVAGSRIYWPALGIFTLDTLLPGKAYHILVSESSAMSYATCPGEMQPFFDNTSLKDEEALLFNVKKNTLSHVFAIPFDLIEKRWENHYLAAMTGEKVIAGYCFLNRILSSPQSRAFTVMVYADDPDTPLREGFMEGERIHFYVIDDNNNILDQPEFGYDPVYPQRQFFMPFGISKALSVVSDAWNDMTDEIEVYPNPTQGRLTISIPPEFLPAVICITGINNNQCLLEMKNQDQRVLQQDISNFPKGIYIIRIESKDVTVYRRIVLN